MAEVASSGTQRSPTTLACCSLSTAAAVAVADDDGDD